MDRASWQPLGQRLQEPIYELCDSGVRLFGHRRLEIVERMDSTWIAGQLGLVAGRHPSLRHEQAGIEQGIQCDDGEQCRRQTGQVGIERRNVRIASDAGG